MAVSVTAAGLAAVTGLDDAEAVRLLPVATEIVEHHAKDAPTALQDESVIRVAIYLSGSQSTTPMISVEIGDGLTARFRPSGSALRLSGAESILAPYRERRADKAVSS